MSRFDLNLLNDTDKGYIIGLFLGDGSFNRGCKEPRFFVRFALDAARDKDVARKLAQIVAYIQTCIEYRQGEKKLLESKNWSDNFRYGFVAGIIDSDGHVHAHLGTEIKTISPKNFESVSSILEDLKISATARVRDAPENSYSKRPRYIIYIPSSEMKRIKGNIPSSKLARYF